MFVSLTTVQGENRPIEEVAMVGEEMEAWLRTIEGFKGIMLFRGNGTAIGLTFWESEAAAERVRALRMEFLERITSVAKVEIESIDGFEVAFARLGETRVDSGA
jgi:hypothetical protein